ncbi:MAG: XdhC family protein, partial [Myxococcales bacterium]|nr:XdhC family protein [Myxococcales bacterium]
VIGAVHIAQGLVPMARIAGYDPVIVDPRETFASAARFPNETILHDWPDEAVAALGLDARTALVLLTHDPKLDDPALQAGLGARCFYIGALGSTRTHAKRVDRLRAAGFGDDAIGRIHAPVGLDIGAAGPAEIAVSILAELIATRRESAARAPTIGAVILAAGASRRAGPRNKLLHPIDGVPMIRRVATTVLAAGFDPCVVVLGSDAERVEAALDGLPVRFVVNHAHAEGMGRSIAAGVEALAAEDPTVEAAAIVLGDMPYLRTADLEALGAAFGASVPRRIVAPEAGEGEGRRLGNPVLWPRRCFAALAELQGDRGARRILEADPDGVLRVAIDHSGVLRDVDVIE